MKKWTCLFTDSYHEFGKVSTITTMAMFAAISVVLGYFTLELGPSLKLGFSSISNQFVCYLFGPVAGGLFGGALDILKYMIKPTGAFFPGLTLSPMMAGVIYGVIYYKKPLGIGRVLAAEFLVAMICNVFWTTYCLSLMGVGAGFFALLPLRLAKNLLMLPFHALLFFTIATTLQDAGLLRLFRGGKQVGSVKIKKNKG